MHLTKAGSSNADDPRPKRVVNVLSLYVDCFIFSSPTQLRVAKKAPRTKEQKRCVCSPTPGTWVEHLYKDTYRHKIWWQISHYFKQLSYGVTISTAQPCQCKLMQWYMKVLLQSQQKQQMGAGSGVYWAAFTKCLRNHNAYPFQISSPNALLSSVWQKYS